MVLIPMYILSLSHLEKHNEVKHNEEKLSKHNEATKSTQFKYKDAI